MINTFSELIEFVKCDLYRLNGARGLIQFLKHLCWTPGFKYVFWMRFCNYTKKKFYLLPLHLVGRFFYHRYTYKYGIWIPFNTKIGKGFYIGHFSTIIIGGIVEIGENCNVSQGVTIGKQYVGEKVGAPVIGDRVYIGPGAKIFGKIEIGNDVAIGANAVVNKDIPPNSIVSGNPGRIVDKERGSKGLVNYVYQEMYKGSE